MSGILTADEQAFLKKIKDSKKRHAEAVKKNRANNKDKYQLTIKNLMQNKNQN